MISSSLEEGLSKKNRINFSILIFFISLLFTVMLWDQHLNSDSLLDQKISSYLILVMGTFYSVAVGLFVWKQERLILQVEEQKNMADHMLQEKDSLLKEIHDRSKNNLQVISSLLGMQIRNKEEPHNTTDLEEVRGRIQIIALIHEILYQSKTLSQISLPFLVNKVTMAIVQTYTRNGSAPIVNIRPSDLCLDISDAIPFGLLVYEALSGSFRHVFTGPQRGEIDIYFSQMEPGKITDFIIKEQGATNSQDQDERNQKNIGRKLIYSLAKQLDGSVEFTYEKGTQMKLRLQSGLKKQNVKVS